MNAGLLITLWTSLMVALSGLALGAWQILSSPDQPNYPTSGAVKRLLMFWFMAALMYRSIEVFYGAIYGMSDGTFLRATVGQAVSSSLMAGLFVTFLIDHCRNWLPERTHRRIRQLLAIARCKPSKELVDARASASRGHERPPSADVVTPALVELHMQGMRVVGPNEGPEAVFER